MKTEINNTQKAEKYYEQWKEKHLSALHNEIDFTYNEMVLFAEYFRQYACEKQNKELKGAVNHSISTFEKMISEWGLNGTAKEFVIRMNIDFLKDALNSKP